MRSRHLLMCVMLAAPLPTMAMDQAACAAFVSEIDANLKQAALAKMLAATTTDPAVAASNAQSAESTLRIVEQNVQMLQQNACPPYPRPIDTTGYHGDAVRCAYDLLKQRADTPPCDQSTWTPKGRGETWHSFD